MAEAFSNSLSRAAGIVTSYSGSTVAAGTAITVTANTGIGVSSLIDNQPSLLERRFILLLAHIYADGRQLMVHRRLIGCEVPWCYDFLYFTRSNKSILIGGTFANNTNSSINLRLSHTTECWNCCYRNEFLFLLVVPLLSLTLVRLC